MLNIQLNNRNFQLHFSQTVQKLQAEVFFSQINKSNENPILSDLSTLSLLLTHLLV